MNFKRGYDLTREQMKEGNVPVVGSNGIIGYHNTSNVKRPVVTVGRSGTVGMPHIYYEDCWVHNTALYIDDFKGNNPEYIFYMLKQLKIDKVASSTGVPTLNRNFVHPLKLNFEQDVENQKDIAKILSQLDEKIELNNQINEELENIAKNIYDYWFVQFDFPNESGKPYRSSGGAMVYNPTLKREIPQGWEVKRLKDIIAVNKEVFQGDKENVYGIDLSVMPSNTMCLNQRSRAEDFSTNQYIMKKYDILFGSIRPYLLKAGFAPFSGFVNGTVHNFSVKNSSNYSFALVTMVSDTMFSYAITRSGGTKMPIIKDNVLINFSFAFDSEIACKYHNTVSNYWELIASNIQQNHMLAELRDFLLPLLMNGQVAVRLKSD